VKRTTTAGASSSVSCSPSSDGNCVDSPNIAVATRSINGMCTCTLALQVYVTVNIIIYLIDADLVFKKFQLYINLLLLRK
jgi:hypothetical protein